jgi:hypothetical protein
MNQLGLSAGTIEYEDTGGDGPTLVLLHGLLTDASLTASGGEPRARQILIGRAHVGGR